MCGLSLIAAGLGAFGQFRAAQAQSAAAKFNARVAAQQAELQERAAREAERRGLRDEQRSREETGLLRGNQIAALAANGLDLSFGSPLDVLTGAALAAEQDAAQIRENARREAEDLRQGAANSANSASIFRAEARNARTAGVISGIGTLVGGVAEFQRQRQLRRLSQQRTTG